MIRKSDFFYFDKNNHFCIPSLNLILLPGEAVAILSTRGNNISDIYNRFHVLNPLGKKTPSHPVIRCITAGNINLFPQFSAYDNFSMAEHSVIRYNKKQLVRVCENIKKQFGISTSFHTPIKRLSIPPIDVSNKLSLLNSSCENCAFFFRLEVLILNSFTFASHTSISAFLSINPRNFLLYFLRFAASRLKYTDCLIISPSSLRFSVISPIPISMASIGDFTFISCPSIYIFPSSFFSTTKMERTISERPGPTRPYNPTIYITKYSDKIAQDDSSVI